MDDQNGEQHERDGGTSGDLIRSSGQGTSRESLYWDKYPVAKQSDNRGRMSLQFWINQTLVASRSARSEDEPLHLRKTLIALQRNEILLRAVADVTGIGFRKLFERNSWRDIIE